MINYPHVQFERYSPSDQPQPGDAVIAWPRKTDPERRRFEQFDWSGVDPRLVRERQGLFWLSGIVIRELEHGGAYAVRVINTDDSFAVGSVVALRWSEMLHYSIVGVEQPTTAVSITPEETN